MTKEDCQQLETLITKFQGTLELQASLMGDLAIILNQMEDSISQTETKEND